MRTHSLVTVTPYTRRDASSRARVFQWLEHTGITALSFVTGEISHPERLYEAWSAVRHSTAPLLLARHAHPLGQGFPERHLLQRSGLGVYDLDDGLPFDDGRLPLHGKWWKPLFAKSRIAHRAALGAHRVIAGNERLAEWASRHCRDVVQIPTCVEPDDYVAKQVYGIAEEPVVGWIGSPATEPHLFGVASALRQAQAEFPFRLEIVSAGDATLPAEIAPFTVRRQWTPELERTVLREWDLGIMPLPNLPYEASKCAYKLLQYGASGLPMVGSPVGASQLFLTQVNAQMPQTENEWVGSILDVLRADATERESVGLRGKRVVSESYSYKAWESSWRRAVGFDLS